MKDRLRCSTLTEEAVPTEEAVATEEAVPTEDAVATEDLPHDGQYLPTDRNLQRKTELP